MKAIIPLILWLLFIAVFSLMPLGSDSPDILPHQDKILHFISYAVLAWLILRLKSGKLKLSAILWAIVLASAYGILIEVFQYVANTGRYFDYFDIIANIIGSLTGSLVNHFTRKK